MSELKHHGVKGMRWGVRRYQNYDGTRIGAKHRSGGEKSVVRKAVAKGTNNEPLGKKIKIGKKQATNENVNKLNKSVNNKTKEIKELVNKQDKEIEQIEKKYFKKINALENNPNFFNDTKLQEQYEILEQKIFEEESDVIQKYYKRRNEIGREFVEELKSTNTNPYLYLDSNRSKLEKDAQKWVEVLFVDSQVVDSYYWNKALKEALKKTGKSK